MLEEDQGVEEREERPSVHVSICQKLTPRKVDQTNWAGFWRIQDADFTKMYHDFLRQVVREDRSGRWRWAWSLGVHLMFRLYLGWYLKDHAGISRCRIN